jgi:hypothetical protein
MPNVINATSTGNGGLITQGDDSGILNIQTNETTAVTIDASQNVGIGTTSPSKRLSLRTSSADVGMSFGTGANAFNQDIDFFNSADSMSGRIRYYPDGGFMSLWTASSERMRIDSSGNVSINQTPGKYTIDSTVNGVGTSIANGGTVDYPAASGMLIVNNWSTGGVTIYICGGGATVNVGSVSGTVGTFSYTAGVYRWTNNYGSTATFGFFFVRTRPGA